MFDDKILEILNTVDASLRIVVFDDYDSVVGVGCIENESLSVYRFDWEDVYEADIDIGLLESVMCL